MVSGLFLTTESKLPAPHEGILGMNKQVEEVFWGAGGLSRSPFTICYDKDSTQHDLLL